MRRGDISCAWIATDISCAWIATDLLMPASTRAHGRGRSGAPTRSGCALAAIQERLRRFRIGQKGCGNGPYERLRDQVADAERVADESYVLQAARLLHASKRRTAAFPLTLTGRPFARVNDERGAAPDVRTIWAGPATPFRLQNPSHLTSSVTSRRVGSGLSSNHRGDADMPVGNRPNKTAFCSSDAV
jgi:hypothetical protein